MSTFKLSKSKKFFDFSRDVRLPIILILGIWIIGIYLIWLSFFYPFTVTIADNSYTLPIPTQTITLDKIDVIRQDKGLFKPVSVQLKKEKEALIAGRRRNRINKVKTFFTTYGSPLVEYASIFVDKAEECGGSYRVLVGIAGSESGLGRINVLKYNPFGFLDGVQYANQKEALETLICKVSWQHLSVCGEDLQCLVKRYAGPSDDPDLFVNKVAWFMSQV